MPAAARMRHPSLPSMREAKSPSFRRGLGGGPSLFASAKPFPLPLSGEIKRGSAKRTQGVHTPTTTQSQPIIQITKITVQLASSQHMLYNNKYALIRRPSDQRPEKKNRRVGRGRAQPFEDAAKKIE